MVTPVSDPDALPNAIAVVGMACRVPGASDTVQMWHNLRDGVESVTRFSSEELAAAGVPPELIADPAYVPARATLDGYDTFDSLFFGITPREANLMDPQHRVLLETVFHALEDSGYSNGTARFRTDLYAGAGYSGYLHRVVLDAGSDVDPYQLSLGNELSYLATRIAYKLDLRGAAVNVDTACSTGLVATHLACQSLLTGQCDMAVAGACTVIVPHVAGYMYRPGGILSADGHCRTFDRDATGFVEGSGAAVVVLRRYADAVRDKDRIHGLIRATAINNDGSAKIGFSAPSLRAQGEVVAEALNLAEISPDDVSYVETHGTATKLGDPIEVAALSEAFAGRSLASGPCLLGSLKTNVGHLGAAAGIAGLIKVILSLENEVIPPSLHFQGLNPEIDLGESRFAIAERPTPWPRGPVPRLAGVTSLGMGGTNVHVVVSEAPARVPRTASGSAVRLLPVSAHCEKAREDLCRSIAARVATADDPGDVAYTLAVGRRALPYRAVAVCRDEDRADPDLFRERGGMMTGVAADRLPEVAFLFPGQGAQKPGMARDLYIGSSRFRAYIDECATHLESLTGIDIRSVLTDTTRTEIDQTRITQPAIFACAYALARSLQDWGISPAAMLGNSIGEYVAATLAGVFDLRDALSLVAHRGSLVQELPPGGMLMVDLPPETALDDMPDGLGIAVVMSTGRCIVAGPPEVVDRARRTCSDRGVRCRTLATSHAFHTAMMLPAAERLGDLVARVSPAAPSGAYVSNVTGNWITSAQAVDPEYWVRHLLSPVRLGDGVQRLHERGITVFVEAGPGHDMLSLVAANPSGGKQVLVAALPLGEDQDQMHGLVRAVGRLWVAGSSVDWAAYYDGMESRRTALPAYPFQRQKHWMSIPQHTVPPDTVLPERAPIADLMRNPEEIAEEVAPPEKARERDAIRALLSELTGLATDQIRMDVSLLSQGFDSVLLLNLSHDIRRRFGMQVGLARLFDDLSVPVELAAFLASGRDCEPSARPSRSSLGADSTAIGLSVGDGFTGAQRAALADLTERYLQRTSGSRGHVTRYRAWHADSRESAAFTAAWKQLCFPIVAQRSGGSHFVDVDGNDYVDLAMGFGVLLLGHRHPVIEAAVRGQLGRGIHLSSLNEHAPAVAGALCAMVGVERAAFCNSGTEAVMTALRLARAATGRRKVVMFSGSYHGTFDGTLGQTVHSAGDALVVGPPGTPPGMVKDMVLLEYASPDSLAYIRELGEATAAILVEPVQSRRPGRQDKEFLRQLRLVAHDTGAALIFDEIITGFRVAPGGAQEWSGVRADLVTYGKALGGGLPIGVVAGQRRFLDLIDSRDHPGLTMRGTFTENPLSMAAAQAMLDHLARSGPSLQRDLNERTAALARDLNELFERERIPMKTNHFGSLFSFEFDSYVKTADLLYYRLALEGIYIWEGRTCFLSTAHAENDIWQIINAMRAASTELRDIGLLPEKKERMISGRAASAGAAELGGSA
jgi:acyl transferase domain-containing protein/glutamate-1-semialdehyde aminotransferase